MFYPNVQKIPSKLKKVWGVIAEGVNPFAGVQEEMVAPVKMCG
jgi:hypothetical protein